MDQFPTSILRGNVISQKFKNSSTNYAIFKKSSENVENI